MCSHENVELEDSRLVLRGTVVGSIIWETVTLSRPRAASVMAANEGMARVLILLWLVGS